MNKKSNQNDLDKKSFFEKFNIDRIFLFKISRSRKNILTRISILFTKIGNGQLWILFASIMLLNYVPIGFAFYSAILIQLYIQILIKNLVKRTRPYLKYKDLENLYDPPDLYSFPSGHTCAAFTMAFVAKSIMPIVWPIFLAISLVISFSRIYLAVHYPSDIFGGIIFAYFSANIAILVTSLVTGIIL